MTPYISVIEKIRREMRALARMIKLHRCDLAK